MTKENTIPEDKIFLGDSYRKMFSFGKNGELGKGNTMSIMVMDEDGDGVEVENIREKDGIFDINIPKDELKELGKGEYEMRIQLSNGQKSKTVNLRKLIIA